MPPLLSEEEMGAMDSDNDSDYELIFMEMLKDICDGSQSHTNVNRRESRYKIPDCIKQRQSERKVSLKATQNMAKVLHKLFKVVVN